MCNILLIHPVSVELFASTPYVDLMTPLRGDKSEARHSHKYCLFGHLRKIFTASHPKVVEDISVWSKVVDRPPL